MGLNSGHDLWKKSSFKVPSLCFGNFLMIFEGKKKLHITTPLFPLEVEMMLGVGMRKTRR
jgi:hypothetical protein